MSRERNWQSLVKRGINNPTRVPHFLLRKAFPSRFGSWRKQNGIVTWNSFNWGDGDNPAQISAINYHMVQALRKDLSGQNFDTAVEIGCGYGRVTPWLQDYATEVIGIDPNEEMGQYIEKHHEDVKYVQSTAQNTPFSNNNIDLIFSRSVLQHIPPKDIKEVTNEITRIASKDAKILLCEATDGTSNGQSFWPRNRDEYEQLLPEFELVNSWKRNSPAKSRENTRERMTFLRK